jgi:hypothetical protein
MMQIRGGSRRIGKNIPDIAGTGNNPEKLQEFEYQGDKENDDDPNQPDFSGPDIQDPGHKRIGP